MASYGMVPTSTTTAVVISLYKLINWLGNGEHKSSSFYFVHQKFKVVDSILGKLTYINWKGQLFINN